MSVSALVFKADVLVVHLHQFGKFFIIFCWSEVSGWPSVCQWVACFLLFLLVCFLFIASGWFARCQWVAKADFFSSISSASGWLARRQWVAHAILSALLSVLFLMSVGGLRVVTGRLLLF